MIRPQNARDRFITSFNTICLISISNKDILNHLDIMSTESSTQQAILSLIKPDFTPSELSESSTVQAVISSLGLEPHIEGGYFLLTDTSTMKIPSPYSETAQSKETIEISGGIREGFNSAERFLSSTIFYYLTPRRPQGTFHLNRSRIIHTLHRGRGRYVLIHPDGHIESFIVGQNIERGERLMWVVEGGVYKASFLLADNDTTNGATAESGGLLISETVVPGFEYSDHQFLSKADSQKLLPPDQLTPLSWLVRKEEGTAH